MREAIEEFSTVLTVFDAGDKYGIFISWIILEVSEFKKASCTRDFATVTIASRDDYWYLSSREGITVVSFVGILTFHFLPVEKAKQKREKQKKMTTVVTS